MSLANGMRSNAASSDPIVLLIPLTFGALDLTKVLSGLRQ
jgi:hypothetical protein